MFCVQFPMINDFGEDRNSYCSFEPKDTALLQSENGNLQQRINILTHEVRRDARDATQHSFVCLFIRLLSETWIHRAFKQTEVSSSRNHIKRWSLSSCNSTSPVVTCQLLKAFGISLAYMIVWLHLSCLSTCLLMHQLTWSFISP